MPDIADQMRGDAMPIITASIVLQDFAKGGAVAKDGAVQFEGFAELEVALRVDFGNMEAGFGQIAGEDGAQGVDLLTGVRRQGGSAMWRLCTGVSFRRAARCPYRFCLGPASLSWARRLNWTPSLRKAWRVAAGDWSEFPSTSPPYLDAAFLPALFSGRRSPLPVASRRRCRGRKSPVFRRSPFFHWLIA